MQHSKRKSRQDRVISRRILDAAAEGSMSALRELREQVNSQNITVDAVEAVFKHMSPELLPNGDDLKKWTNDYMKNGERFLVCFHILTNMTLSCIEKKAIKESIIEHLCRHETVDTICNWLSMCLRFEGLQYRFEDLGAAESPLVDLRHSHSTFAVFLNCFIRLHHRVTCAFSSSLALVNLILRLWVSINDDTGKPFIMLLPEFPGDPIILLLWAILENDDGLNTFLQTTQSRRTSSAFAMGVKRRIEKLSQDHGDYDLKVVAVSGKYLAQSVNRLIRSSDSFFRALSSVHYLKNVTHLLMILGPKFIDAEKPNLISYLVGPTRDLVSSINTRRTHFRRHWCQLYLGGFVPLISIIYGWLATQKNPDIRRQADEMIQIAGAYTAYPTVVLDAQAMHQKVFVKPSTLPERSGRQFYPAFYKAFDIRSALLGGQTRVDVNLCDYLRCASSMTERSSPSRMKQCSRCRIVVYCSEGCQVLDWRDLHFKECKSAREEYEHRKTLGTHYDLRSRSFQTNLICSLLNEIRLECWPVIEETANAGRVLSLRLLNFDPEIGWETVDDPSVWWKRKLVTHPRESYLAPRLRELWADPRLDPQMKSIGQVRLVDVKIPLGPGDEVHLSVVVRRRDVTFEPVYSVSRYASAVE